MGPDMTYPRLYGCVKATCEIAARDLRSHLERHSNLSDATRYCLDYVATMLENADANAERLIAEYTKQARVS